MGRSHGQPSIVRACEMCGTPYKVFASSAGRVRTCSPSCKSDLLKKLGEQRRAAIRAELPDDLIDRTPPSVKTAHRVERTCVVCDVRFLIAPAIADAYATCSRRCSTLRRKSLGQGETECTCKSCGAVFSIPTSLAGGARKGDYCSNSCRIAGLNALPRTPPRTAKCRICGKDFRCPETYTKPDADGKTRGIYCSRTCMWTDDDYRKRRAAKHSPTRLEQWLFRVLDDDGIAYDKFATVGRYVPDAILTDYNVIIEVDGVAWHAKRVAYDQQRDADLAAAGYTVMHFTDREITGIRKARELIGSAIEEVRNGQAKYKPSPLYDVS